MADLIPGGALTKAADEQEDVSATQVPPTPASPPETFLPTSPPISGTTPVPILKAGGRADTARQAIEAQGLGRLPSDPEPNKFDELMLKAKSSGYSWGEITDGIGHIYNKAVDAGYKPQEIRSYFGFDNPERPLFGKGPKVPPDFLPTAELEEGKYAGEALKTGAQYVGAGFTHPTDLVSGLEMSSGGMPIRELLGQKDVGKRLPPTDQSPDAVRAQQLGELLGDAPLMLLGAAAGYPVGGIPGAGFGAGFLPAWVRAHYVDQAEHGPYLDPHDYSLRTTQNLLESFASGTPGLAAGIVGPLAGRVAGPVARLGVEAATMTAVSTGIEGHLPSSQDFLDGALQIGIMHGIARIPGAATTILKNLRRNYVETGELPSDQVERATADPSFGQTLVVPPRDLTRPGSSVSPAGSDGQLVVQRNYATVANMGDPRTSDWAEKNITTVKAPNGASFEVNKEAAEAFRGFLKDLDAAGYHDIKSGGGFNVRNIRGGTELSQHAFGAAIDINPDVNPSLDVLKTDLPPNVSQIAAKWGLQWGGDWQSLKDPMHFQWNGPGVAFTPGQVSDRLLNTVAHLESGDGTDKSIREPNSVGALGKFQITRDTAKTYNIDYDRLAHDDAYSETAARTILSDLSKRYQGEQDAMLIAYNAGKGTADRWIASGRNNAILPEETKQYLSKAHQEISPSTLTLAERPIPGSYAAAKAQGIDTEIAWLERSIRRTTGSAKEEYQYNLQQAKAHQEVSTPTPTLARVPIEEIQAYKEAGHQTEEITGPLLDYVNRSNLGKETVVYRGMPANEEPGAKNVMSVSPDRATAEDFATIYNPDRNNKIIKITVDPRAPSVDITGKSDEPEILLGTGKYTKIGDNEYRFEPYLKGGRAPSVTMVPHAGAGAATPGFVEEEAAPFVPPTFEESRARIGASIQDERVPTTLERFNEFRSKAYRDMLRPDNELNKIQAAYEDGRTLPDTDNPKLLRRVAELSGDRADYGVTRNAIDLKGNVTGPGFLKIIDPLKSDADHAAFEIYAKARWALEKAAQAKETGVAYLDAQNVVQRGDDRFRTTFDQLVDFRNNSLALLRDSGIVSKEMHDRWVEENKAGVPGYRLDDERPRNASTGKVMQSRNPVKEMMGSDLPTLPVLKTILQDHGARTALALRNQHNIAFTDMTREMGLSSPAKSGLIHIELTDAELRKIGLDPTAEAEFYRKLNANIGPNDLIVFRDGKPTVEHFDNPLIAEALKGTALNMQGLRDILSPIIKANKVLRGGVALNPIFAIRNLIYDLPMRGIVSGNLKAVMSLYKGIGMVTGMKPAMWDRWLRSGGSDYARAYLDTPYIQDVLKGNETKSIGSQVWNAITTPNQGLQAWSRNIMSTMPAGRFAYGVENLGESDLRAGVASSEFKLHRPSYGGPVGKFINSLSPFTLAHYNAMEQTLRGMVGKPENAASEQRSALAFHASAVAWVTAPMILNWALGQVYFKKAYDAAPEWQKNNGLIIPLGGNTHLYWPLPPLLGAIYGGLPRMLLDRFTAPEAPTAYDIATTVAGALIPQGLGLVGGATLTAAELISNHSFLTGRQIVPTDVMNTRLGPEQAVPWSSGVARNTSLLLNHMGANVAPQMVDAAIQGLTGTLGKEIVAGADSLFQMGAHAPGSPEAKWSDFPGLSSHFVRYPSASAEPTVQFMNKGQAIEQLHGSIEQAMKTGQVDRAIDLMKQPDGWIKAFKMQKTGQDMAIAANSPEDRVRLAQAFNQMLANRSPEQLQAASDYLEATKAVDVARKVAQVVQVDRNMSPSDKRQNQDKAYINMQAWSTKGLAALHRLEE